MITTSSNMDIMAKALDAYTLRNSTIASNIANQDTPGYKRKEVKFEEMLNDALSQIDNKGRSVANRSTKARIANQNQLKANTTIAGSIKPEVYDQQTDSMYRIDGNNVDIDNEMSELVKNQLRYSVVLNQVNKQFQAMRTAMGK